jgi:hypothetical protein
MCEPIIVLTTPLLKHRGTVTGSNHVSTRNAKLFVSVSSVIFLSEFLATILEFSGSIPGATTFSEMLGV